MVKIKAQMLLGKLPFTRVCLSLFCCFISYFAVLSLSSEELNNFFSLMITATAGIVGLATFCLLIKPYIKPSLVLFAIIFYLIRLLIGTVHYLYFFDGNYLLNSTSSLDYLFEYMWLFDTMDNISGGLSGALDADQVFDPAENKNYEMIYFMSFLFLLGGTKILSIATFNSLAGILSALLVFIIAREIGRTNKEATFAFVITALQPFEMFTSIFARDTFGQLIVFLSIYLVLVEPSRRYLKYILIALSAYISGFVREVYLIIPIFIAVFNKSSYALVHSFHAFPKKNLIYLFIVIFAGALLSPIIGEQVFSRFLEKDFLLLIFQLPISLIYSLVGPFPWTQFLLEVPGWEFQFSGYLTSVFNVTLIYGAGLFFLNNRLKENEWLILLFILIYYLSGILVYGGKHTVYYSLITPLLALFFMNQSLSKFYLSFFMVLNIFLLANILYINV
jgi:hypothetical protein